MTSVTIGFMIYDKGAAWIEDSGRLWDAPAPNFHRDISIPKLPATEPLSGRKSSILVDCINNNTAPRSDGTDGLNCCADFGSRHHLDAK